jgi:hypothetical protein
MMGLTVTVKLIPASRFLGEETSGFGGPAGLPVIWFGLVGMITSVQLI